MASTTSLEPLGSRNQPGQVEPGFFTHWSQLFRFSTDHKLVGLQYMVASFAFFLVGGLLAMLIRAELLTPELNVVTRHLYNGLFTIHGSIMIFLWTIPFLVGLTNFLLPLMVGARDVPFPVLNGLSFWVFLTGGLLLLVSFFTPSGVANSGWWSYPPLSLQEGAGNLLSGESIWLVAVLFTGVSSIMGAVNFVSTVVWMRAPGMTFFRMPIFVWAAFSAQVLQLIFLPVLTADLIMLFFDLNFGTPFFDPAQGGNPVLYQHLFWFYSHPTVYVWILPVFGIFSEIIPAFSRNPLFGYRSVAIATVMIAVVAGFVWVHHMFAGDTPGWLRLLFMVNTGLVAIPTGIKVFAWTATIWKSKLHLDTAMLFAVGALVMFVLAGITGIMLSAVPFDLHANNTYFVVAHFHYVVNNTIVMGLFAAVYFWFPKITGRMLSEGWGKVHFALMFLGSNLTFFPMHILGLQGMVRRVASYAPDYQGWNIVASLGAFLLGVSILPFLGNVIVSWNHGPKAGYNPWHATGLEWSIPSPVPTENFATIPTVLQPPYNYGDPDSSILDPTAPY
jgi:cytochrome c oxidase subunit 1